MAEAGINDFVVTSWAALVVPNGTPRAVIDRLSVTIREIAAEPDMKDRFLKAGAKILSSTPEAAKAYADKERAIWREIVRISGAKLQQ
jgi:tripartite-type tricarboxylate transporter receptor subunit TctC